MNSRISRKDKGTTLIKMVQMVSETPIFKEALKLFLKTVAFITQRVHVFS